MAGLGIGMGLGIGSTNSRPPLKTNGDPSLLLQTELILNEGITADGALIRHLAIPWIEIQEQLRRDKSFIFQFARHPRKFEEFLASCYDRAGFDVQLTHQSGDLGRDLIATKPGRFSLRILDQAKAFSDGRVVGQNDVRAMMHVINNDRAASKGYVTTTSTFAPGVYDEFKDYMPTRLELRDGKALADWIDELKDLKD